jgi:hypothetical protein
LKRDPGGGALRKVGFYLRSAKNMIDTLSIDGAQKPADQ